MKLEKVLTDRPTNAFERDLRNIELWIDFAFFMSAPCFAMLTSTNVVPDLLRELTRSRSTRSTANAEAITSLGRGERATRATDTRSVALSQSGAT